MPAITLRAAGPQDEAFLFTLFSAAPEFALLPLPEPQKQQLIRMQYEAQRGAYEAEFPGSGYDIVLRDGQPVGRIWIARRDDDFYLVDIALLPENRNAGIGSAVIGQLLTEAEGAGKPVHCSVFRFNAGSLRFHQRLGFTVVEDDEMRLILEWRPRRSEPRV